MRNDTAEVSYRGERTADRVTADCHASPCEEHYVVRIDGTWVRGFHNERDARMFADDLSNLVKREG